MCSVSAVSFYYTETFPQRAVGMPANPFSMGGLTPPVVHTFDVETKEMMLQALRLLDRIDKRLGDVECMDDAKAAFMKSLDLDPNNIGG